MVEALEDRTVPATFTVVSPLGSGAGSLSQAILNANANAGLDRIEFNLGTGPATISPTAALPGITSPVFLDGTTQPGYAGVPLVQLDGNSAG